MISYIIGTIEKIEKINTNKLNFVVKDYNNKNHNLLYKMKKSDLIYSSDFKVGDNISVILKNNDITEIYYTNKILENKSYIYKYNKFLIVLKKVFLFFLFFQVIFLIPAVMINPKIITNMSISEYHTSVLSYLFYLGLLLGAWSSLNLIKNNIKAKKYNAIIDDFLADHERMKI